MITKKEMLDMIEQCRFESISGNRKGNYTNPTLDYHKHKQMVENYNRKDIKRMSKILADDNAHERIKQHDSRFAQAKLKQKYMDKQLTNQQNI
jgi:beta-N-acetylglucosaminidase